MSELRCFTLLGDSNVRRNVNKNTIRGNVFLKNAQILSCGSLAIFPETLKTIRAESDSCILSCLSNFLSSAEGPDSVCQRVDPVLQDIRDAVIEACEQNPQRSYLLSPPMYRTSPVWYREGLPEILNMFSSTFRQEKPDNLHLLPSFAIPEYDSGGVHLTPYSGLEFIMHLFDSSNELLDQLLLPCEDRVVVTSEAGRVLEDRVMVLEQDHRRLNRVVEAKTAEDAEIHDFHANERLEAWFVVTGLPAIPSEKVGKEWQDQATSDVQKMIVILMGREMDIIVVKNATTRQKDAEITYNVKMADVNDSKAIRRKFGSFYLGGKDKRPDPLKHLNVKVHVTPETNIRISILKLLAKRYKDSNPSARVQVMSYDTRPLIKITPASDASDRRVMLFNYVEAVRKLPVNFSSEELRPILRRVNPKHAGQVRSIFVVLSDDEFRQVISKFAPRSGSSAESSSGSSSATSVQAAPVDGDPPEVSAPTQARSGVSRSKSQKRGASTALGCAQKK